MDNDLLTEKQLAPILGLSVHTIRKMRYERRGPPFVRLGLGAKAKVRYNLKEVKKWAKGNGNGYPNHP